VKKGNFIRKHDQKQIRLIKNYDQDFIYLKAEGMEYYFNLETLTETEEWYGRLEKFGSAPR
jgi:hypothetical protein